MTTRPRLIIVSGLPGTGKTTVARRLEAELDACHFGGDDWIEALALDLWDETRRARVEALQWQVAQRMLRAGVHVIVEWGTWMRAERDALRERAHELGATAELVFLDAPVDELARRVAERGREDPPMTVEHLAEWSAIIERPTADELARYDVFADTDDRLAELTELETGMWRVETRADPVWMDQHLAPDFAEHGRSGRHWTRAEIIAAEIDHIDATLPLPDLAVRALTRDIALVTYRSQVAGAWSLRMSLWRDTPSGWQLEFHQGTPVSPDRAPTSS